MSQLPRWCQTSQKFCYCEWADRCDRYDDEPVKTDDDTTPTDASTVSGDITLPVIR